MEKNWGGEGARPRRSLAPRVLFGMFARSTALVLGRLLLFAVLVGEGRLLGLAAARAARGGPRLLGRLLLAVVRVVVVVVVEVFAVLAVVLVRPLDRLSRPRTPESQCAKEQKQ